MASVDSKTGVTTEKPINVDIPRSTIYVSTPNNAASVKLNGEHKTQDHHDMIRQRYSIKSDLKMVHFYLILQRGHLYTDAEIENCQGKYRCANCTRPIPGRIYFLPVKLVHPTQEAECEATPYCRDSCVYRAVQDRKANDDLIIVFGLVYGLNVRCAPPRFLLYGPKALTVDEYHQLIDDGLTVQEEDPNIRSFLGPTFVSVSLLGSDHQLVPEVRAFIDAAEVEHTNSVGPSRNRDNSGLEVVAVKPKSLTRTRLAQAFTADQNSFDRVESLRTNPHMQ